MTGLVHNWAPPRNPARVVVLGSRGFVGCAVAMEVRREAMPCLALTSQDVDLLAPGADATLADRLQADDSLVIVSALTPDRGKDIATFQKNLRMMETVCAALSRREVAHVVNIGSDAVYADDAALIDESSPVSPGGFHGMMHAARELMLRSTVKAPLALLRPSLIYGAQDSHNGYGPNRFRRTAAQDGRIALFGAGEEKRDHIAISDVARLVALVLRHRSSGILNLVTGRSASFRAVADLVARQFPRPVAVVEQPRGGPVTHRHFAIGTRLRAFPGFRPVSLEQGLAVAHREAGHG